MKLDHFVVHVDKNVENLQTISIASKDAGMPFNPKKGKGNSGFKVTNIWIGQQYFEIPWLTKPHGGGWRKPWVDAYNSGSRGIFCIFLKVNNIESLKKSLEQRQVKCNIEKTTFKGLFGLFEKTMPWTCLHLPAIPGTNLEISFIEYEPGIMEEYLKYMKPNSTDMGVLNIRDCEILVPNLESARAFLSEVFPDIRQANDQLVVHLDEGNLFVSESATGETSVQLIAQTTNNALRGKNFSLENVTVNVN